MLPHLQRQGKFTSQAHLCHSTAQPAAFRNGIRIKKQFLSLSAHIPPSEQANTQPLYTYPNKVTPSHGVVPSLISDEGLLPEGWHVILCLFSTQTWCQNASPHCDTTSRLTPLWWHPCPASSLSLPPPSTPPAYPAPLYSTGNSRPKAAEELFALPTVFSPISPNSLSCPNVRFSLRSPPFRLPTWASICP